MTYIFEIDKDSIRDSLILKNFSSNEKSNNLVHDLKYTVVKKLSTFFLNKLNQD